MRDLNLSKELSEILASPLGEHGIAYWIRELKLHSIATGTTCCIVFFTMEDEFMYCNNAPGPLKEMGLSYNNSDEWRLSIDGSTRSLKCVLLHKGNKFACVPIGHSVVVKEHYLNVKMVLNKFGYNEPSITGPHV